MIQLTAEFQTYWQISTGRGAGDFMDSLIDKDQDGLPHVSGKTIKGLFRDAVEKIVEWQDLDTSKTKKLFGSPTGEKERADTEIANLAFSSLRLSADDIMALNQNSNLKPMLTHQISSTKIEHKTGIAQDKSLRTQQVAKPLKLIGEIEILNNDIDEKEAFELLKQSSVFITNIGAKKSRGYGQVQLSLVLLGKGR